MIVGLTGGIGSGKSVAASFFYSEGVTVVDADHLAREVIEQNTPGFQSIVDYFGSNILGEDGSIDRAQLRKEIFDDKEKKKVLESITHPMVRDLMAERIAASTSPYSIVIDCDSKLQLERATLRDDNSSEQIQKILDSQCSRTERLSIANDVIPNNDSLENLKTRSLAMHKFYLDLCKR